MATVSAGNQGCRYSRKPRLVSAALTIVAVSSTASSLSRTASITSLTVLSTILPQPCAAFVLPPPGATSSGVPSPSACEMVSTLPTQQLNAASKEEEIFHPEQDIRSAVDANNASKKRKRRSPSPSGSPAGEQATPVKLIDMPPVSFEDRWNARYEELVEYKRVHGDCLIPQAYKENPALGRWVRSQRVEFSCLRKGHDSYITQDRIDKLNALGFVWDAKEATWNMFLEELRSYKEQHGHCHVPQYDEKYKKLALWVRNQRMHYAYIQRGEEEKSTLTPERIKKLEKLDFIWDVNDVIWMEKFNMLKDFMEEFGHTNVPSAYEANKQLARWCAQQRYQYKNLMWEKEKNGRKSERAESSAGSRGKKTRKGSKRCITQRRVELLNSLNFVWDPSEQYWWEQYAALKSYREENGDCAVPVNYPTSPQLGHWVANQRRLCRSYMNMVSFRRDMGKDPLAISGLNEERLKALRELNFEVLPSTSSFEMKAKSAVSLPSRPAPRTTFEPEPVPKVPRQKKKDVIPFPWDEI